MTEEWRSLAACGGTFDDRFLDHSRYREAVQEWCLGCEVLEACLWWGVEHRAFGCYGGVWLEGYDQVRQLRRYLEGKRSMKKPPQVPLEALG